jgi:hypothetical protein
MIFKNEDYEIEFPKSFIEQIDTNKAAFYTSPGTKFEHSPFFSLINYGYSQSLTSLNEYIEKVEEKNGGLKTLVPVFKNATSENLKGDGGMFLE